MPKLKPTLKWIPIGVITAIILASVTWIGIENWPPYHQYYELNPTIARGFLNVPAPWWTTLGPLLTLLALGFLGLAYCI